MIIIKEEFTAGQFDLPYVKIYSTDTTEFLDTKTNEVYKATKEDPLAIELCRYEDLKEIL